MFVNDYIMRMIMQITHFIARIVRLQKEQRPEQALVLLGQGYAFFFSSSIELMEQMSVEELRKWMRDIEKDSDEGLQGLLEFMHTHVQIREQLIEEDGDGDEALDNLHLFRMKMVTFYLRLVLEEARKSMLVLHERQSLEMSKLLDYQLPIEIYQWMVDYYVANKDMAKAEDVLYLALETIQESSRGEQIETWKEVGLRFYETASEFTDEQLAACGLSMDEIWDGRQQWLVRYQ